MDKTKLKDSMGRALTQALFLEINYETKYAVYTLDDDDKEYKGKTYPSLKKLFLESEDPTEYAFANEHLLGWSHWIKLNGNAKLRLHFDRWRDELEIAIRSAAIRSIIDSSTDSDKGFQASKWLADKGWVKRTAGRPSKEEIKKEAAIRARIQGGFDNDHERLVN